MLSVSNFRKKLEKITRTQKLFITMMIVAGCLLFYAIGIVTNFFGQPIFSMFFIISEETAHNLVVYVAVGAAIAIGSLALFTKFLKKPKSASFEIPIKPAIPMVQRQAMIAESVNLKISGKPEVTVPEIKKKPVLVTQSAEILKVEKVRETTNQQIPKVEVTKATIKGKFTCPSCKKEFSTPMQMLDFPNSKTDLVNYCPYCFNPID
jgi:hypothetical protein